jgi:hypothetical protein
VTLGELLDMPGMVSDGKHRLENAGLRAHVRDWQAIFGHMCKVSDPRTASDGDFEPAW